MKVDLRNLCECYEFFDKCICGIDVCGDCGKITDPITLKKQCDSCEVCDKEIEILSVQDLMNF